MKLIKPTIIAILGLMALLTVFKSGIHFPFFETKHHPQNQQWHVTDKEYFEKTWYKSTFPRTIDSVLYHTRKHGKGRSPLKYTQDAIAFYDKYKHLGKRVKLSDGTPGIKIRVGIAGGYWTSDGRIVTFWD